MTTLTVGVYYAKYILNDAKLVGNIIMYHHFPALVVMLLVPIALDKGASKRTLAILSGVSMLLGSLISLVYASGVPFIISMGLRGIGFGAFSSVIYGMLADTVEYGEWKTGVRTQAINVTANGVGQKIGSGLGTAAFGGLLTMCGYNGMAEVQTASAVSCIRIIFIVAPIAIYLILIVLAWMFKLDKQFPQIQKELEERKRSKASAN